MNKILLFIATIVATMSLWTPASAQSSDLRSCRDTGSVSALVVEGADIYDALAQGHTFETKRCNKSGMRLVKTVADTANERKVLRAFSSETDGIDWPVIYCRTDSGGYSLELAFYYSPGPRAISERERTGYRSWARSYAQRHGCRLF